MAIDACQRHFELFSGDGGAGGKREEASATDKEKKTPTADHPTTGVKNHSDPSIPLHLRNKQQQTSKSMRKSMGISINISKGTSIRESMRISIGISRARAS